MFSLNFEQYVYVPGIQGIQNIISLNMGFWSLLDTWKYLIKMNWFKEWSKRQFSMSRYHLWWHVSSSDHIIKSISLVKVNQAIFAWSFRPKYNIKFCDNVESFSIVLNPQRWGLCKSKRRVHFKVLSLCFIIPDLIEIESHYSHHDENKCFYFLIFSGVKSHKNNKIKGRNLVKKQRTLSFLQNCVYFYE